MTCEYFQQPLYLACKTQSSATIKQILLDQDSSTCTKVFQAAALYGRIDIVQDLLDDPRVIPGANRNQALRSAARHGHIDVLQLLVNHPRIVPWRYGGRSIKQA